MQYINITSIVHSDAVLCSVHCMQLIMLCLILNIVDLSVE